MSGAVGRAGAVVIIVREDASRARVDTRGGHHLERVARTAVDPRRIGPRHAEVGRNHDVRVGVVGRGVFRVVIGIVVRHHVDASRRERVRHDPRLGAALQPERRAGNRTARGLHVPRHVGVAGRVSQRLLRERRAAVGGPNHKDLPRRAVRRARVGEAGLRVIREIGVTIGRDRRVRRPHEALVAAAENLRRGPGLALIGRGRYANDAVARQVRPDDVEPIDKWAAAVNVRRDPLLVVEVAGRGGQVHARTGRHVDRVTGQNRTRPRIALRDVDVDAAIAQTAQVGPEQTPLAVVRQRRIAAQSLSSVDRRRDGRLKRRAAVRRNVELKQRRCRDVQRVGGVDGDGGLARAAQADVGAARAVAAALRAGLVLPGAVAIDAVMITGVFGATLCYLRPTGDRE
ncbi:MAG: hypothetical protein CHACPFDD_02455 [Phycisphaerae bacterium]|nr:hypothetical protein [Phycisphaerae bacterium]